MDIGIQQITDTIIGSTTDYLVTFSPIFLLMAGLILAFYSSILLLDILGYVNYKRGFSGDGIGGKSADRFRQRYADDYDFDFDDHFDDR